MSFITILETLLIGPLKLIFEIIFYVANQLIGNPGLSIIVLSLVMNILVLPLYRRADAMQEAARDVDAKLNKGVSHIKKTFSGDERMMILQAYYRQNNYKPTDALNGSVSLLLEIPFFMAAYQFLSTLETLNGAALGPIANLGAPDGLLVIGGVAINLLPVLMTLINVISSAIYLKGFPAKTKIQLYAMAAFFLVFLYTSPSGLVFYWTLNNVFSLVKTIFYKLKNPKKVVTILASAVGLFALIFALGFYDTSMKRKVFVAALGVLLQTPLFFQLFGAKLSRMQSDVQPQPDKKLFTLGCLFLTVLIGGLIPSTFIAASPQEYVSLNYFHNPAWYVVSSLCLAAGFFLVWMGVFYWLASPKGKVLFGRLVWILCGIMLVNYMFFGTDLGVISFRLQYESGLAFTRMEKLINLAVIAVIAVGMYLCAVKWKKVAASVLLIAIIALGGMTAVNMVTTINSINQIQQGQISIDDKDSAHFQLSTTEQNVVVIMLDRALGEYVPFMMKEKPQLQEQFDGFTYYSNTVSFGNCTNFGTPPIFGGYEYTPVEMNKRDDELLVDKHNEALTVMPLLFSQNGFDVTVCDPPYANYQWIPDLSIFDAYPEIKAFNTDGMFIDDAQTQLTIQDNHRNFFCFSVMKTLPLVVQPLVYNNGNYNHIATTYNGTTYGTQTIHNMHTATGLHAGFMDPYNVLVNLPGMTQISQGGKGGMLMLSNDATHEPALLQAPNYVPQQNVDNTQYDAENSDRFHVNGSTLATGTAEQMRHYHTNLAVLMRLGEWFDYLREQGVYDNTRIILVSDHGYPMQQIIPAIMDVGNGKKVYLEYFAPLLMVKDFNAEGFITSDEFMTHADVPTLAVDGVIANPKNPFTGKPINNDEKTAHDQILTLSREWQVATNNGTTFLPGPWASVHTNLWDKSNWSFHFENAVLTEHALP